MTRGQPSLTRTAHGTGAGALLRVERPALDETAAPNADDTAQGLAETKRRGKPFKKGNRAAENRKPALAVLNVNIPAADPRYVSALRKAKRYVQRRVRELTVQCGGSLGSGPCAMLASAGRALAASVLLNELAASQSPPNAKLFVDAAQLADKARQQELTAQALAEREAAARNASAKTASKARLYVQETKKS